ncbi:MAG: hypothetical protein LBP31_02135, partial [Holosporales bacterium]|nr:hypothetical protein [Holosporales bacterium]
MSLLNINSKKNAAKKEKKEKKDTSTSSPSGTNAPLSLEQGGRYSPPPTNVPVTEGANIPPPPPLEQGGNISPPILKKSGLKKSVIESAVQEGADANLANSSNRINLLAEIKQGVNLKPVNKAANKEVEKVLLPVSVGNKLPVPPMPLDLGENIKFEKLFSEYKALKSSKDEAKIKECLEKMKKLQETRYKRLSDDFKSLKTSRLGEEVKAT